MDQKFFRYKKLRQTSPGQLSPVVDDDLNITVNFGPIM